MWKNINALGFASLRVLGVICSCRLHTLSMSLPSSGLKGRSMCCIDAIWKSSPFMSANPGAPQMCGQRTRFLQEPICLALADVVIFGWCEEAEPVQEAFRVRAGVEEVKCEDVRLGPEQPTLVRLLEHPKSGVNSRIWAINLQHIIAHSMYILRPALYETIG